jgi:hypothetical protein
VLYYHHEQRRENMSKDEIIAWALAHAVATLDGPEDAALSDLLHEYGGKLGIDVPAGDEYQRAVLHHFDPDRVPDFPLPDAAEREAEFRNIHGS